MRYFYQKGDEVILKDGLDKLPAIVLATQSSPHHPLKRIKLEVIGFTYYCYESDITPKEDSNILPDLRPVVLALKASLEELTLASKMNELLLTPKFQIDDHVFINYGYPSQGRVMEIEIRSFRYPQGNLNEFAFFIKTESDFNGTWYRTRDLFLPKPQKSKKKVKE